MTKLIGLDIGHGEDTSGKGVSVNGKFYKEHTFNSNVGVKLKELLEYNGFKTFLAQEPYSKEVSLRERIAQYNSKKVDIVWSIHADANGNRNVSGRWGFYWYTSINSKLLANKYAEQVKLAGYSVVGNGTRESEPETWSNFAICRDTNMPACLTENGFMTNADDFKLLFETPKYIDDVAEIHAKTICSYFGVKYKQPEPIVRKAAQTSNAWEKEVENALLWAEREGISDLSRLDDAPTRKQLIVMLYRALGK